MDDWKIEKTLLLEALLLRVAGSNSCQVLLQPSSGKQSIELSLDTIKQVDFENISVKQLLLDLSAAGAGPLIIPMLSAGKDVNEELPPLPPRENIVKTVSTVEAMDPLDGRVERSNTESDGTDLSVLWTDACTTVPTTEPVNIEAQLIAAINDFNHKNRYVAHLPIQSDDQLRQCAYEDLLLFVHQLKRDEGDSGAEQPAITKLTEYIDETLRLQMNISVKKYQRSKQIAAALCDGTTAPQNLFDIRQSVIRRHAEFSSRFSNADEHRSWRGRLAFALFNNCADQLNYLPADVKVKSMLITAASSKSFLSGQLLDEATRSLLDLSAQILTASRSTNATPHFDLWNLGIYEAILQSMIQINLAESNGMSKWSQYRLFIVGPSELDNKADLDVEFNLLDRFRQFIFAADCSTEIKSLFHSIAVFRLIYRELNADISAGKDVAAGISLAQMTLDQLTRRLSLCGKIGITGIDIAFAQPFYRSKVLLRNYGTYLRAVEKQDLLKQCLSTFLSLCPLFVRSLQYDNPLEFPLKSNDPLAQSLHEVLSAGSHTQYLNIKNRFFTEYETTDKLDANDGSGVPIEYISKMKRLFLEDLELDNEVFAPTLIQFIAKKDIWRHLLEPRFNQLHAEIISLTEYPPSSPSQASKPALDQKLVSLLGELHMLNNAIYQMALVYLGEEILFKERYPLTLFDLDGLVQPYLKEWLKQLSPKIERTIRRCFEIDNGKVEDERLNITSSVTDVFEFLYSIVEIFFSLPGMVHQQLKQNESSDSLQVPSSPTTGKATKPAVPHSLLPLRGVHRVLKESIVELVSMLSDGVRKFAELNFDRSCGVWWDNPAFDVFNPHRKKKATAMSRSSSASSMPSGDRASDGQLLLPTKVLLRRINNLIYAKYLLVNHLENRIIEKASERGGLPDSLKNYPDFSCTPLFQANRDSGIYKEIFSHPHSALKKAVYRMMIYAARNVIYVDLRKDLIDGLYNTEKDRNICLTSFLSLSPIVESYIQEMMGEVKADVVLQQDDKFTSNTITGDSVQNAEYDTASNHMQLVFFKTFLEAYEAIVIMDAFASRRFEVKHIDTFLEDIAAVEKMFGDSPQSKGGFQRLPLEGVKECLDPLKRIVSTLFPMDTKTLIRTYEKLASEEEQQLKHARQNAMASGAQSPLSDTPDSLTSLVVPPDSRRRPSRKASSVMSTEDVLREMEYDQARIHEKMTKLELLDETLEATSASSSGSDQQQQDRVTEFRRIFYLPHNFSALRYRRPINLQKDLPGPPLPSGSSNLHHTNPFKTELSVSSFNVWSAQFVFNTIARRAGYGNAAFFPQDTSSTLLSVPTALFKKDTSSKEDVSVTIIDKPAYTFIKKYGMKRWMMKRFDKIESLADRAREKFSK